MAKKEDLADVQSAYNKVQSTINALRADYDHVCSEIGAVEKELKALPLALVPPEDLKAGILEFIEASGRRYGDSAVKSQITSFATGEMMASTGEVERIGKPLRFRDLQGAITGSNPATGWAQLLSTGRTYDDRILYCFAADLVKAGLRRIVADMTPTELGYGDVDPREIGTDRATRLADIGKAQARLAELIATRADLADKLESLGAPVKAAHEEQ